MSPIETMLTKELGIEIPLICGAMYPCSNPELVAAVSAAGGIGIIQPVSLRFAHNLKVRDGIRHIKSLTDKPVGFNAIVEKTHSAFEKQMREWIDIALEEGIRFFVTALGSPQWVADKVHAVGGLIYHDVTERKWADKALAGGVDGLICVNDRAGGHAGTRSPKDLYDELAGLGVPLICAGGVGDEEAFVEMLEIGYQGAQLGTRFIATTECRAHWDYKQAILRAVAEDIVLTDKISGVPVSIIKTPHIEKTGTEAGPIAKRLLKNARTKPYMRLAYALKSAWQLRRASLEGLSYKDYFQAGKSVEGIHEIEPAGEIVRRFGAAAEEKLGTRL